MVDEFLKSTKQTIVLFFTVKTMKNNRYIFSRGSRQSVFSLLILFFGLSVVRASALEPSVNLLRQSEERQTVIDKQLTPQNKTVRPLSVAPIAALPDDASQICFPIHTLALSLPQRSSSSIPFYRHVTQALKSTGLHYSKTDNTHLKLFNKKNQPPCLSAIAVRNLSVAIQNNLIQGGWITSRVIIPDQTLKDGILEILLRAGLFAGIKVDETDIKKSHANRLNECTAFPMALGEPLNLRDVEQSLENLRRLPTVHAELGIVPGSEPDSSYIELKWRQKRIPVRCNLSIDDSGNDATGKYLATIGLSWDNPLRLNEIFSVSYTHNLPIGTKKIARDGHVDRSDTSNYSIRYNMPYGYWEFNASFGRYNYDQVIAGVTRNYHYSGESNQTEATISRVLYRNGRHKFSTHLGAWRKTIRNYIDDAEITVQRRRTAGWKASLSQLSYFKRGTLNSTLSYKRGTRAFDAIPAPEELFDEGTAKCKIWTLDIDWQMPLRLRDNSFIWHSQLRGQLNRNLVTPQERFSLGGRYNVRGFTGAKTLSAERGWYLRNDLAWHYRKNHQLYVGADIGHVSGPFTFYLPGKMLSGAVLGIKGQFQKKGRWSYDIFIGTPVYQPNGFNAESLVSGFNFTYSL